MAKVNIIESSRPFSKKEELAIKMGSNAALKLDQLTKDGAEIKFSPEAWAILEIERENDAPFNQYIVIDKEGRIYSTGSASFWDSFRNIYDEMKTALMTGAADPEDDYYEIRVFQLPSKKYTGKSFITCAIVF